MAFWETTQKQKIYFENQLDAKQKVKFENPLQITGLNIELKPGTGAQQVIVAIKDDYLTKDFLTAFYSVEAVLLIIIILFFKFLKND